MNRKFSPANCRICSNLSDLETGSQKFGWEEFDTYLPDVYAQLTLVKDLKPGSCRSSELLKCPLCGTYYLFSSDYDYLVNGSEDEQTLARLTAAEAENYMNQASES